jgi:hypothetical protein
LDSLAEEHGISQRNFDNLLKALDKGCVTQGTRITDIVTKLRKASNAQTSSASPSKSKGAQNSSPLKKRKVASIRSDTEDIDSDDEMALLPKTPTKKQKVDSSSKLMTRSATKSSIESAPSSRASSEESNASLAETPEDQSSSARVPSSPRPTSTRYRVPDQSRVRSDAMDIDSESGVEVEEPTLPKRFRPVFLDYKQWYQRDPRLEREWKDAEKHKESMLTLYPHPFEKYRPAEMEVEDV